MKKDAIGKFTCNPHTQNSITRYIFSFSSLYKTSTRFITFLCFNILNNFISL